MKRALRSLVVALAVPAIAGTGCGGDDDAAAPETTETSEITLPVEPNTLLGSVGPGFEIALLDAAGASVSSIASGTYTITVDDRSDIHNFHLTGGDVDVSTDVGGTGGESFDVELSEGTYSFVCDPHASSMNGSFEVSG
ncbi:MAG TPA: plastocyanin/azurin family copper-binding protein [Gaiellaceae bacterium]|nr:plastocyanin/azurin family copper-binding protein [Gaiellaceae bacterium]